MLVPLRFITDFILIFHFTNDYMSCFSSALKIKPNNILCTMGIINMIFQFDKIKVVG